MKVAIMQPYFFPYIGYFQLMNSVDKFIIYDNIQFTKKGWIQRNRILLNHKEHIISLPIKKDSSFLNIDKREISHSFIQDKEKLKRKVENAYKKAPNFDKTYQLFCSILDYDNLNLFDFLFNSINLINKHLNINVELIKSSELSINIEDFKGENKVLAILKSLEAVEYINPIRGTDLYKKLDFHKENINLHFIKSDLIEYKQYSNDFIPWLSIIDIMMFNNPIQISKMLNNYKLT